MNEPIQIEDDILIGGQPTLEQLQELRGQGVRSIVNFREDFEDDAPISPAAEGRQVREMGMDYVHVPVPKASLKPEIVGQFRRRFEFLDRPIFAHCGSGKRAGAMVMMALACENGWSGEETIRKAEELGFECDQPEMRSFVKNYVNNHTSLEASVPGAG